jgi:hypothetical protein
MALRCRFPQWPLCDNENGGFLRVSGYSSQIGPCLLMSNQPLVCPVVYQRLRGGRDGMGGQGRAGVSGEARREALGREIVRRGAHPIARG